MRGGSVPFINELLGQIFISDGHDQESVAAAGLCVYVLGLEAKGDKSIDSRKTYHLHRQFSWHRGVDGTIIYCLCD